MESQFNSCLFASLLPPLLSSSFAAAESGCRHSAVSSSPYLPVSVKNVGGLEDGGGTELASEAADGEMLLASGRLLAVPGSPHQPRVSLGSWRLRGVAGPKRCPPGGDPPCVLRFHPEPGTLLTWDNLSRSGKTDPGSWHSFPNLPDPSINASFFKRVSGRFV